MKRLGPSTEGTSSGTWGPFSMWALLGASAAFGVLVFPFLAAVPVLVGVWLSASRPALRRSWFGAMTGIGAMSCYVAYVQRRGPGTVCWQTATASGCDEYLNPWPWLAVGAVLVIAGVIAHARRMRARS